MSALSFPQTTDVDTAFQSALGRLAGVLAVDSPEAAEAVVKLAVNADSGVIMDSGTLVAVDRKEAAAEEA